MTTPAWTGRPPIGRWFIYTAQVVDNFELYAYYPHMTIHTTFPKGKTVHIIMTDGRHLVGKFVEKKSRFVVFDFEGLHKKLAVSDIRSTSIER